MFFVAAALAGGPPRPKGVSDPGVARSAYEKPEMVPPLAGAKGSLDLGSLGTTITTFTLEADVSGVDAVQGAARQKVLERLMIDPRWRVVDDAGTTTAYLRTSGADGWTVPYAGFHRTDAEAWRVALRCGKRPPADPWLGPQVAHTLAASPKSKVNVFHPRIPPGWSAVAVSWDGRECALEVYEGHAGDDLDLPHLVEVIGVVPGLLTSYASASDYPVRGEPASVPASVAITWRAGQLDVRARAHPPEPGVTWVRILDEKGAVWEERAVGTGTRERLGWSADPAQMYYLQGSFPVPAGPGFGGTAEVWFQAAGQAATKLHTVPVAVPVRP